MVKNMFFKVRAFLSINIYNIEEYETTQKTQLRNCRGPWKT